jgi:acetyl-CoA carboxylase biotin carboxyl carrier protein
MPLSEDEVREILKLLEVSSFDFMQLEVGDLKLVVSKGSYVPAPSERSVPAGPAQTKASGDPSAQTGETPAPPEAKKEVDRSDIETAGKKGLVPITAPMVGTFYTTPEPGAPPFVSMGAQVDEDTTVGLIEVMKVFTAVKSGIRGVVAEIFPENGQFVEYGQALFLVKPAGSGHKS